MYRKSIVMLAVTAGFALLACRPANERAQLVKTAQTLVEDPMNPMADFIKRQLAQGKKPNRLIHEKSPYLLQHAFNPVDWYPWGEEAFERARKENKPIFLSIGYSTCHWCHVMEHESFENPDIAAIMNQYFINIKVDREERPDVDQVYMRAVQALTGSGGWPMSVFLTPDRKPFFGGTYFPPESRYGRVGFRDLLLRIHEVWEKERDKVLSTAEQLTDALQRSLTASPPDTAALHAQVLDRVYEEYHRGYDAEYGGFFNAPKFPRPSDLNFLFHYYRRTGQDEAREMALFTLRQMARGGMYDHLGGGFHRYSVDRYWRVPHFEKMLYDQAQLVGSYLDAYQLTGEPFYARIARETLGYVLRDMTSPGGAFYSAEDADSAPDPQHPDQKLEGAFYMWTREELDTILGPKDAEIFAFAFGVEPGGNTISDPHGEFGNRNVLYAARTPEEVAQRFGLTLDTARAKLSELKAKLFAEREKRPRPALDDKIITAWNGLMISALARAGAVLNELVYSEAAAKAAAFIKAHLWDRKTNRLFRRYRDGEARYPGHLDDYAFFIHGLLDLYEATAEHAHLQDALTLADIMVQEFHDSASGSFFDTAREAEGLLFRSRNFYDGAEPAGNSMAIFALLRLGRMLDRTDFVSLAERALKSAMPMLEQSPAAYPQLAAVLDFALSPPAQIVIAGPPDAPETRALLREVHRRYLPNKVLLYADGGRGQNWLAERLAFIQSVQPLDGRPAAYVCENFTCDLPVAEPSQLAHRLETP